MFLKNRTAQSMSSDKHKVEKREEVQATPRSCFLWFLSRTFLAFHKQICQLFTCCLSAPSCLSIFCKQHFPEMGRAGFSLAYRRHWRERRRPKEKSRDFQSVFWLLSSVFSQQRQLAFSCYLITAPQRNQQQLGWMLPFPQKSEHQVHRATSLRSMVLEASLLLCAPAGGGSFFLQLQSLCQLRVPFLSSWPPTSVELFPICDPF